MPATANNTSLRFRLTVPMDKNGSAQTIDNNGWKALLCPFAGVRHIRIKNMDGSNSLSISTDSAGASGLVDTIAKGAEYTIDISNAQSFGENEVVCYLKGDISTQPIIHWSL